MIVLVGLLSNIVKYSWKYKTYIDPTSNKIVKNKNGVGIHYKLLFLLLLLFTTPVSENPDVIKKTDGAKTKVDVGIPISKPKMSRISVHYPGLTIVPD